MYLAFDLDKIEKIRIECYNMQGVLLKSMHQIGVSGQNECVMNLPGGNKQLIVVLQIGHELISTKVY